MDDSVARFSRFRVATITSPPVVGSLRAAHIIVFPEAEGVCVFLISKPDTLDTRREAAGKGKDRSERRQNRNASG